MKLHPMILAAIAAITAGVERPSLPLGLLNTATPRGFKSNVARDRRSARNIRARAPKH